MFLTASILQYSLHVISAAAAAAFNYLNKYEYEFNTTLSCLLKDITMTFEQSTCLTIALFHTVNNIHFRQICHIAMSNNHHYTKKCATTTFLVWVTNHHKRRSSSKCMVFIYSHVAAEQNDAVRKQR
jgi:hypothetical protein